MIDYNANFYHNSILPFFLEPESDPNRGQVQFCRDINVNLFEKGIAHLNKKFLK